MVLCKYRLKEVKEMPTIDKVKPPVKNKKQLEQAAREYLELKAKMDDLKTRQDIIKVELELNLAEGQAISVTGLGTVAIKPGKRSKEFLDNGKQLETDFYAGLLEDGKMQYKVGSPFAEGRLSNVL